MAASDPTEGERSGAARIDNFVDAAFAFAVTLLVIGDEAPPSDVASLMGALTQAPGFAAGFALIAMFWWAHRSYARVRPEGAVPLLVSLAIVFVVLVYVYPLRLFSDMFASLINGAAQRGAGPVRSLEDMGTLYVVYGSGFAALSALYVVAFAHAAAKAEGAMRRSQAVEGAGIWIILTASGLLSAGLALALPLRAGAWAVAAPGMAYWLIPVGIGVLEALRALTLRKARADA